MKERISEVISNFIVKDYRGAYDFYRHKLIDFSKERERYEALNLGENYIFNFVIDSFMVSYQLKSIARKPPSNIPLTFSSEQVEEAEIEFAKLYNDTTYEEESKRPYAIKMALRLLDEENTVNFSNILLYRYPHRRELSLMPFLPSKVVNPHATVIEVQFSNLPGNTHKLISDRDKLSWEYELYF